MRRVVISFLKWCLAKLQGPDAAPESPKLLAPTPPDFPDTVRELTEEQLLQEALLNAEWESFVFSRRWLDLPPSIRKVSTPDGRTWAPGFVYPPGLSWTITASQRITHATRPSEPPSGCR